MLILLQIRAQTYLGNFYSSQNPSAFNSKCVQLIGKCFRDLETLSIGGYEVDLSALSFVGEFILTLKLGSDLRYNLADFSFWKLLDDKQTKNKTFIWISSNLISVP